MPVKLTAAQSTQITSDCVRQVSGSTRPFNPAETLQVFGINSTQQVGAVRTNVVSSGSIGVPAFNFSLNPGFLATLSNQWLMGTLSDVIRQNSVPLSPALGFAATNIAGALGKGAGAKKPGTKKPGTKESAKRSAGAKKASKKSSPSKSAANRSSVASTKRTSAKKTPKRGKNK